MKFKKFITVSLLASLCVTASPSLTVKASVGDAVVSSQVTDTTNGILEGGATEQSVGISDLATVSGAVLIAEPEIANAPVTVSVKKKGTKKVATTTTVATSKTELKAIAGKAVAAPKKVVKKKYTNEELRLMSCIIYAEANGEPYAGKLAVGIVVMNRKKSKSFPNTVKGVIYQKYQFGPVRNGALERTFREYDAGRFTSSAAKACVKAAKEALEGATKVTYNSKTHNMKNYYFFNTYVSGKRLQIKNHQFK